VTWCGFDTLTGAAARLRSQLLCCTTVIATASKPTVARPTGASSAGAAVAAGCAKGLGVWPQPPEAMSAATLLKCPCYCWGDVSGVECVSYPHQLARVCLPLSQLASAACTKQRQHRAAAPARRARCATCSAAPPPARQHHWSCASQSAVNCATANSADSLWSPSHTRNTKDQDPLLCSARFLTSRYCWDHLLHRSGVHRRLAAARYQRTWGGANNEGRSDEEAG